MTTEPILAPTTAITLWIFFYLIYLCFSAWIQFKYQELNIKEKNARNKIDAKVELARTNTELMKAVNQYEDLKKKKNDLAKGTSDPSN